MMRGELCDDVMCGVVWCGVVMCGDVWSVSGAHLGAASSAAAA